MNLLGWREAEVQLRFCAACFHSMIFPKFDTAKLYGDAGSQARKKAFESYFPGKVYGERQSMALPEAMERVAREFLRFHRSTGLMERLHPSGLDGDIKILDWGGGDGYISGAYASALAAVTGAKVKNYVYDFSEWQGGKRFGMGDLKRIGKFHMAIFSHVLEHTHDPVGMLKAALPFLANDAIIICEVPDERTSIVKSLAGKKFGLHYHVCHFSRRSLGRALNLAGFGHVFTQYQPRSSYRGEKMSSIVGVAQFARGPCRIPSFAQEVVALIVSSGRKAASKMDRRGALPRRSADRTRESDG